MKKTNLNELEFRINQLRKDNIIYAADACATSLLCLLISFISTKILSGSLQTIVMGTVTGFAIIYTIYMWVGNFIRFQKINDLERDLIVK